MTPDPRPPHVFLSYSHDSQEHKDRVLALCDRLRADGIDAWLRSARTRTLFRRAGAFP
jgi:hypothetical protein